MGQARQLVTVSVNHLSNCAKKCCGEIFVTSPNGEVFLVKLSPGKGPPLRPMEEGTQSLSTIFSSETAMQCMKCVFEPCSVYFCRKAIIDSCLGSAFRPGFVALATGGRCCTRAPKQ